MRRGTAIFVVINLVVIGYIIYACSTLIGLLFEDGAADAIRYADIPGPGSALTDGRKQVIPKILHQTYINSSIPAQWKKGQKACLDLHQDYEYKLWTDEKARAFIEKEYAWFLDTFDSYPHNIQRADSIRYFVLAFYGGIYIDLDDGCKRKLDPLLLYPAWVRQTVPTGISNDAMGAVPQHPFFLKVIDVIAFYNRNWGMPYITIMYSTGPLFLSVVWKEYLGIERPEKDHVSVLMPDEYKGHEWSFFNISKGSSWHGKDAQTIFWMGKHWLFLTVTVFVIAGVLVVALWWAWSMWFMRAGPKGKKVTSSGRGRGVLGLFWRGRSKERYELVDRMA